MNHQRAVVREPDDDSLASLPETFYERDSTEAKIRWVPSNDWREVKIGSGVLVDEPVLIVSFTTPNSTGEYEASTANGNKNRLVSEEALKAADTTERKIPNRIAINSNLLLTTIQSITKQTLNASENVIVHPFKLLLAHETKLRNALEDAKIEYAEKRNLAAQQDEPDSKAQANISDPTADADPSKSGKCIKILLRFL